MPDGSGRLIQAEDDAQGWTPVSQPATASATQDDSQGWTPVAKAPAPAADDSQGWTPVAQPQQAQQPTPSLSDMILGGETQGAPQPTLSQTVAPPPAAPAPPPDPTQLVQDPTTGQVLSMPFTPQPPDTRQGFLGGLVSGGQAALAEGNRMTAGETFTPHPVDETQRTFMGNVGYGLAHSSPVLGAGVLGAAGGTALTGGPWGGVIGSGLAMGAMAAAQSLAPAYDQARKEGLSHEDAVNRAIETAAVSGGISGLSAGAYAIAPFRSAISNILLHSFVTAPTIGTAERAAIPLATGQPMPTAQQFGEGALTDVATGAALSAAHAGAQRLMRQPEFPTITPTGAEEQPGRGPPEQGQLPAPQERLPPPGPSPEPSPVVAPPPKPEPPIALPTAPTPEPAPAEPGELSGQATPIVPSPSTGGAAPDIAPVIVPPPTPVIGPPVPPVPTPPDQEPSVTPDTTKTPVPTTEGAPGSTRVVATAHPGIELPTEYHVVEADTLKPATGDLQPRDRAGRAASDAQIAENAARLDPGQVTTSPVADYGAPVVMPDGTVLAGNGRLAAIQRAAELHPEKYQAYIDELTRLGHDTTGMTRPVLVRRTGDLTPDQARIFAEASNVPRAMTMSPVEQAKVDARNLSSNTLAKYNPDVALTHGSNAGFIRDWMQSLPPTERNRVVDAQGQLSSEGLRRLQGAVLAKAYDHDPILRRALESPNDDIKSITNSLMDVAAPWVKMREAIGAGRLPDAFNITDNLTQALDLIQQARAKGQSPGDIIAQQDVFTGKIDPITEQLVRTFYNDRMDRLRSRKGITDALRDYVDQALAFKPGKDLLGQESTPDPAGALKRAREGGQPGLLDKLTAENLSEVRPDGEPSSEVMAKPDEGITGDDEQFVLDAAFEEKPPEPTEETDTRTAKSPELQSKLDELNRGIERQQAKIAGLEAKTLRTPGEDREIARLKQQNARARTARDQLAKRTPRGGPVQVQRKRGRLVSPFKPKPPQAPKDYLDYQFRDGTSVWNQAFVDAGYDPNLAVNKPIAWQIQTLARQTQKKFGLTSVTIAPNMDHLQTRNILLDTYRATVDMMASLGYPHDALGLFKTVGLVLEPYTPKVAYAGMYDPNTRIIHLTGTANSLGHEWTHALDHYLLDQLPILKLPGRMPLASVLTSEGMLGNPNESIAERFSKVLVALFHDDADLALRTLHLERAAGQVDKAGNPTQAALVAQGELNDLRQGVDTGTVQTSKLREASTNFGGGPGVDDYYGTVYEMLARAHEAVLARLMENNAIDPRGVVMENEAFLNDTIKRLRDTYPKDDEYLRVIEAFKQLHTAIQNKLYYDAPGGLFSTAGQIDLAKVARLGERLPPGMLRSLRRGIVESVEALRHPIESWRVTQLTDPNRPDAGDRPWTRRSLDFAKKMFATKIGALQSIHDHLPANSKARGPVQKIIDKLGPVTPGSGRATGTNYEERSYSLGKNWTRQFVNIMTKNGLTPKTFSLDRIRGKDNQNDMLRHALVTGEDTYQGKPLPANVIAAAGPLRELSNAVFKSNQDAGMDITYAKNGHFMRMYDHPAITADLDGFKDDARKLHKFMFNEDVGPSGDDPAALLKRWRDLSVIERGMVSDPQVATDMVKLARNLVRQRDITRDLNDPASGKDKTKLAGDLQTLKDEAQALAQQHHDAVGDHIADLAAEAWADRINGGYPDDFDTVGPSGNYLNKRVLPPEADTIMEKWMVRDVNTVMPRYYLMAARKQASIELFGKRDAEFEALLKEARAGGLHHEDNMTIRAMKQAITGRPPGSNHGFGQVMTYAHAYGALTLLGRSALSMASEPLIAGMTTGDVRVAFKSVLNQLGALRNTLGSQERAEISDLVGVTVSAIYDDMMLNRTGADYADSLMVSKLMGMYYRLNLMTQWNNGTRRASMGAHNWFLTKLANDWGHYETTYGGAKTPPKGYDAARAHTRWDRANHWLNELGVPTDKETRKAFTEWMVSHDGLPSYDELEGDTKSNFAPIYQRAMNRLVNRAVQNPTKAERPLISDSPYGIIMQFQSFNYAMGRNVVGPALHKISEDVHRAYDRARGQGYSKTAAGAQAAGATAMSLGNLALTAGAFLAATMLAAAVKLWAYANDVFEKHRQDDTLYEYLFDYAMNQSGLPGAFSLPISLWNDIRYANSLSDIFAGPGMSQAGKNFQTIMLAFTGGDSPETATNTRLYNGTKAAYNMAIVPLEAMLLSRLAGGFGPMVAGLSTLSFASLSSRPFSDVVAETVFGQKGTALPKPEADDEGELKAGLKSGLDTGLDAGLTEKPQTAKEKAQQAAAGGSGGGALLGIADDFMPPLVRWIAPYAMALPGPAKIAALAGAALWGGISFWNAGEPFRNAPPPGAKGEP